MTKLSFSGIFSLVLIVVVLCPKACIAGGGVNIVPDGCSLQLDALFVFVGVDSASRQTVNSWKNFAIEFVRMSVVSDQSLRISLFFTDEALTPVNSFKFVDGQNDSTSDAVIRIQGLRIRSDEDTTNNETRLVDAFRQSYGSRRGDAEQVCVVVVDKQLPDTITTVNILTTLQKLGVSVLMIGVTSNADLIQLRAHVPSPRFIVQADSYANLHLLVPTLLKINCAAPPKLTLLSVNGQNTNASQSVVVTVDKETVVGFHCEAEGNPSPNMILSRRLSGLNVKVQTPARRVLFEELDVALTLSVRQSDIYVCSASSDQGTAEMSIAVVVNGPPELYQNQDGELLAKMIVHGTFYMTVKVISNPRPTGFYLQYLPDREGASNFLSVPAQFYDVHFSEVDVTHGVVSLNISAAFNQTLRDCRLVVENGMARGLVIPFEVEHLEEVPVVTNFTVSSQTTSVPANSENLFRFFCQAKGHPPPILAISSKTIRNNVITRFPVMPSGSESLDWTTALTQRQSDVYECRASNRLGVHSQSVTVSVKGAPIRFYEADQQEPVTIKKDGIVSIRIKVIANPEPTSFSLHRGTVYNNVSSDDPSSYEVIPNSVYTAVFTPMDARFGFVFLKFKLTPYRDVNHYILMVGNGLDPTLSIPFEAVLSQDAKDTSYSDGTSIAVIAGSTIGAIAGLFVLVTTIFLLLKALNDTHASHSVVTGSKMKS